MKRHSFFLLPALLLCGMGTTSSARADEILVSAASSLTEALKEIGKAYSQANPQTQVRFNFASSGALQQQIEQGAPVDVFASAGLKEMEALQKGNHIETATRITFAGNRLVLIVPLQSRVKRWEDLKTPSVRHIALSNPTSVPSGRYAQETLTKRDLWSAVQPKAVLGQNVRQTLTYVANGDAEAGIVFATDARLEAKRVRVVQEAVAGKDHEPILYPAAVISGRPNLPSARRFVQFLQGPDAQRILVRYGFTSASPGPANKKPGKPGGS